MIRSALILIISATSLFAAPYQPSREELLETVKHIQRLAKDLQNDLDAANDREKSVKTNLKSVQDELGKTQANLVDLQLEVNELAAHDASMTAKNKEVTDKYHRLKLIACLIAAAAAVFLVMRFTAALPAVVAPYKIYAYAGAGVLAATLVWTLL